MIQGLELDRTSDVVAAGRSTQCDVVIVGAGPVGLAAAIELGRRKIRCLLVERNDRVGYAPRAKTTNVRTRTHLRRWGIAQRLAERAPFGIDYPSDVHFVTRLAGAKLASFSDAFNTSPTRNVDYPEHAQWIPQYALESVLREEVARLETVEVRFNTEYARHERSGGRLSVSLQPVGGGARQTVATGYLIGADGARSLVRESIGAEMRGRTGLSRNCNVIFHAPNLATAHRHGPGVMYWQVNADVPSVLGPMDSGDVWFITLTNVASDLQLSQPQAMELITRATGFPGEYTLLRSDSWSASRLIASRYRQRNVFLIGDACHLHPPFGGYGMNMGIGDAVDLGWKLGAVIQGWGGSILLDSYEIERKPVHEWIMDEAEANHALLGNQLWRPGLEDESPVGAATRAELGLRILEGKRREFHTLGAVLGYCYTDSPVIASEADRFGLDALTYRPSSQPGCLAPHLWVDDQRSFYDLFGDGFALLIHGGEAQEARMEARSLGVPLQIIELPRSATDRYPRRLTLVRPDQHVAWRGDTWLGGALARAAGRMIGAGTSGPH